LAETLNTMLERLQTSMQTERDFLDRASHELRTPLTVLKAELELALARPRTPAELEAALRASSQEVETLVRLAEDLLVLSRERDGQLPVRKEPVHIEELLERLGAGFAAEARSAGVEIHVQVEPGLHLSADPIRLRQAVSNLVLNALQHTPAGGRIDLEARHSGATVSIEVRDSGRGFGVERLDGSAWPSWMPSSGGTGAWWRSTPPWPEGWSRWCCRTLPKGSRWGPPGALRAWDNQPRPSGVQCAVAVVRKRSVR